MGFKARLEGQKFNRLTVLEYSGSDRHSKATWKCLCECGSHIHVSTGHLKTGHTKSCGCFKIDVRVDRCVTHGQAGKNKHSPEYRTYNAMKTRCNNKNHRNYSIYGGRGIKVCDSWLGSFESFLKDMGVKPSPSYSLDRIDANGDYTPENCRWATATEQCRNQRVRKDNKTGIKGVAWSNQYKKWCASIKVDRQQIKLGYFDDIELATEARKEAEIKYWNKIPS